MSVYAHRCGGAVGKIIQCVIDEARAQFVMRAIDAVGAFYPDIDARITDDLVTLSSDTRSATMLRRIWSATIANERLIVDGQSSRDTVLRMLVE